MVEITMNGDSVVFEMEGLDKLWTLRSRLQIPLAHIKSVRADPEAARGWWHGFRIMGTNLPGILTAGTFYQNGKTVFWDVHDPERTIVLELEHEFYDRLVMEVDQPPRAVSLIQSSIGSARD